MLSPVNVGLRLTGAKMELDEVLSEELYPGNIVTFRSLAEFVRRGGVTALTGAGVSAALFPTWAELLRLLIQEAASSGLISHHDQDRYKRQAEFDSLECTTSLEQALSKNIFRPRFAKFFENKDG